MKIETEDGDLIARIGFDPYEIEVVDEDRYPGGFEGMDERPAYEHELPEDNRGTAVDDPRPRQQLKSCDGLAEGRRVEV